MICTQPITLPSAVVHNATPDISVIDNQGQTIRLLQYCRSQISQPAEERIQQQRYNGLGQLMATIDARFFTAGSTVYNFQYQHALDGQLLYSESVDSGKSWQLADIEGRLCWQRNARGTVQCWRYDPLGRLTERSESHNSNKVVCERLIYGETATEAKQHNLRGQLIRHYDTAGLLEQQRGFTVAGSLSQQTCRLLPVESESDWSQGDERQWQSKLEAERYTTYWQHDLNNRLLIQTDAKGHRQRLAYNVTGYLKGSWVQLKGAQEHVLLKRICYSAAGQKLSETAGNDLLTEYRYEPETQRLIGITSTRPKQGTRKTLLQQLRYQYDPVGNITACYNDAEAIRFFNNQPVAATAYYRYDSLYQLIEASGQENATLDVQYDNPAAITPLDSVNLVNYNRRYQYDAGGNLIQIQHNGAQNYTRNLVVSNSSNHALLQSRNLTPEQVRNRFDACGNPNLLNNSASLRWNSQNQLQSIITITRSSGLNDQERYQYNQGMRLRKSSITWSGSTQQQQEVIYLPGLELRRSTRGVLTLEQLEILTIGQAGRNQIRLLNWISGKSTDIPNQQLRYSLDDLLGSTVLDLGSNAEILTIESYYPYGGTAVRAAKTRSEAKAKITRYCGKERDSTGLYYYGYRYYQPWLGRWLNPDPAGTVDGLNLFRMVRNNPVTLLDRQGNVGENPYDLSQVGVAVYGFSHHREATMHRMQARNKVSTTIDEFNDGLSIMGELSISQYFSMQENLTYDHGVFNTANIMHYINKYQGHNAELAYLTQQGYTKWWWAYMLNHKDKLNIQQKIARLIPKKSWKNLFNTRHYAQLDQFIYKNSEAHYDGRILLQRQRDLLQQFATKNNVVSTASIVTDAVEWSFLTSIIANAFFRQTSKLGISWLIDEVGINEFKFIDLDYDGSSAISASAIQKPWKEGQRRKNIYTEAITYSEWRYAIRKGYGPKIDFVH